jgi:hypothetical protein
MMGEAVGVATVIECSDSPAFTVAANSRRELARELGARCRLAMGMVYRPLKKASTQRIKRTCQIRDAAISQLGLRQETDCASPSSRMSRRNWAHAQFAEEAGLIASPASFDEELKIKPWLLPHSMSLLWDVLLS